MIKVLTRWACPWTYLDPAYLIGSLANLLVVDV